MSRAHQETKLAVPWHIQSTLTCNAPGYNDYQSMAIVSGFVPESKNSQLQKLCSTPPSRNTAAALAPHGLLLAEVAASYGAEAEEAY